MVNDDLVHIPEQINVKQKKPSLQKKTSPRENKQENADGNEGSDDEEKAIEIELLKDPNQEVYVFPTFFRPGRHTYVVRYINDNG